MADNFFGRKQLLAQLDELWGRQNAVLCTCRGRRRIGKSTLIERFAQVSGAKFWSFEGLAPQPKMTNQDQIDSFVRRLAELSETKIGSCQNWFDVFRQLEKVLPHEERMVLLLDEISWMGKYDVNFPGELKFAFDRRFHSRRELIVVLCGSVSSWIEHNILSNTGFVGRVSLDLLVPELSLAESVQFWGARRERVSTSEVLDVLSVTGGVPRYLEEVDPALSADENIRRMCFRPNGYLFRDFDDIFSTVFAANSVLKRRVLETLAHGMMGGAELATELKVARNGQFTEMMRELELAGFVSLETGTNPESGKRMRDVRYRLRDNYSRFYLKYVLPHAAEIKSGRYEFATLEALPEWNVILGLQFENLVLNDFHSLLKGLHLEGVQVFSAAPFRKTGKGRGKGVQVDLLIQTKKSLVVVEVKRQGEIGESVEREVEEKVARMKVRPGLSVRTALVYAGYLAKSVRSSGSFDAIVSAEELLA